MEAADDLELTPDRSLRAISALEAALHGDREALLALAAGTGGEPSLARVTAAFGAECVHGLVTAAPIAGPSGERDAVGESAESGWAPHLASVWEYSMAAWAQTVRDPEALAALVGTVLGALLAFVDLDESDPAVFLARLREHALNRS